MEGFPEVEKKIQKTGLPKKPELIFTSNCFDTDEIFKIWVANCVSNGSRYFVGQHGANYGTSRYMNPSVEEQTSDKFLTWGWQGTLKQHQPCFLLKGINDIGVLPRLSGDGFHFSNTLSPSDGNLGYIFEHSQYFLQQKQFIAGLDDKIRSVVTVRLHPESQRYKFNDLERWRVGIRC